MGCDVVFMTFTGVPAVGIIVQFMGHCSIEFITFIIFVLVYLFFPLKIKFNKILVCIFREPVKMSVASYKIRFCMYYFQILCIADYMPTNPPTIWDYKVIMKQKLQ